MSSLPANYVTLVQLKERYLKEKEREQKEKEEQEQKKKEEEELRRLKLREEEEAKLRRPDGVVVVRNRRRFDRREFGPVADRREFRPVVDRSVSEKSEEPEEEKKQKKKKKKKVRADNEEVSSEKEGVAVPVVVESGEKASDGLRRIRGERRRAGAEFRGKSKNLEETEPKFRDLTINGEAETGGDRLMGASSSNAGARDEIERKVRDGGGVNGETKRRNGRLKRPNFRNVGAKGEIEPEGRDFGMNGETERGNDRRRPNCRNGGAREEIKAKVGDLEVNSETERGSDRLMEAEGEESDPNVKDLSKNGENESLDRLREPNSKSKPKVRDLVMTGEIGGGRNRLWMLKGKNVGGKDETGPKVMDSLVKAESGRGAERLRRQSGSDYHGYRKSWSDKREQSVGLAWVKKGEVSDGNAAEVQSSEHSISGLTRASLNATSLKSVGPRRLIQ